MKSACEIVTVADDVVPVRVPDGDAAPATVDAAPAMTDAVPVDGEVRRAIGHDGSRARRHAPGPGLVVHVAVRVIHALHRIWLRLPSGDGRETRKDASGSVISSPRPASPPPGPSPAVPRAGRVARTESEDERA